MSINKKLEKESLFVFDVFSSNYHTPIPSHPIKLDVFIEEFFDDGNAFAGKEGAEDDADADSVESVKDGEGKDDRR